MRSLSVDIFCRVIDNFGDAGVCWRLARQLANHPKCSQVQLYIDDLDRLAHFQPGLDPGCRHQKLLGVNVTQWREPLPACGAADVVIEAFGCSPGRQHIQRMLEHGSLWINLEYLSAEPWVGSFHRQPSLQANGLKKYFFFPGFSQETGGLLREPGLIEQRDAWRANPMNREQLHQALQLPELVRSALGNGARQILLFCYEQAAGVGLVQGLQQAGGTSVILVPQGVCPDLKRGTHANVLVHEIPFLDQPGFDHLLWSSDLNCVRGEDSLVRALWAASPLLWHIYPQDDDAHHAKLQAWLNTSPLPEAVHTLMQYWNHNNATAFASALAKALEPDTWKRWQHAMQMWQTQLCKQTDLADALISFCAEKAGNG